MSDLPVAPGRRLPGRATALRIDGVLVKIEDTVTVAIVGLMFILIFGQVIARYVIPLPLFWVEEVARMGMVWLTFTGAALVTARLSHLAVTAVSDRSGPRARRTFLLGAEFSILITAIVLIPATWHIIESVSGVTSSSGILPRSVLFVGPLVGWVLMAAHALINLLYKDLHEVGPEVTE